uniref:Fibronectin type-III domain-containing protein n=1 Tax=Rhipicephalus appendiculatus TaxID=34631 RepID=A0A131YUL4_RHIAP
MACVSELGLWAGLLLLLGFSTWTNALVKTNGSEAAQQAAHSTAQQKSGSLVVGLSRASESYAEIAWRLEPGSSSKDRGGDDDEDPASRLSACELAYGPLEDPYQVEVMSNFMPRGPTFIVSGLRHNTTYHFHMVCYCCLTDAAAAAPDSGGNTTASTETKITSNVLRFTTGAYVGGDQQSTHQRSWPTQQQQQPQSDSRSGGGGSSEWRQRDPYQGSYHSVYKQTILRDEESSSRAVPSFNVLLGALTGIVGFLIINVTVVIAVRRCSHRRMRRRRILVLEDRDNEDFPYLRPLE